MPLLPRPTGLARSTVDASVDVVRHLPSLAFALAPTAWPRPAAIAGHLAAGADARGASSAARRHARWVALLGSARPLSPLDRDGELDDTRVRRIEAIDALADLEWCAETASRVLRTPWRHHPVDVITAAVIRSLASRPVAVAERASVVAGLVARTAPAMPKIRVPHVDRANLLTTTLAEALPGILDNAALRHVVLRLPEFTVGVRSGRSASSITFSRRGIRITNGLARTASFVVDGDVPPVLRRVGGSLLEELDQLESEV